MSAVLTAWAALSREAAMSPTISENASFSSLVERMLDESGLDGSAICSFVHHSQANAGDGSKKGQRAHVAVHRYSDLLFPPKIAFRGLDGVLTEQENQSAPDRRRS